MRSRSTGTSPIRCLSTISATSLTCTPPYQTCSGYTTIVTPWEHWSRQPAALARIRFFSPRSCIRRLNSSFTSSAPLGAQDPLGLSASRRFVQMKTCFSKCGSAIRLASIAAAAGRLSDDHGAPGGPRLGPPRSQLADRRRAHPALKADRQADAYPVLIAVEKAHAQAREDLEAGLEDGIGAFFDVRLIAEHDAGRHPVPRHAPDQQQAGKRGPHTQDGRQGRPR